MIDFRAQGIYIVINNFGGAMEFERTLVILKPDVIIRGLVGEIIKHYECKMLSIKNMKMVYADESILDKHYKEHIGKPFYPDLIRFMKSGPVIVMIVEGVNAIETVRKINGATDPREAECGSIRGIYANSKTENCVHGSDSKESAIRECEIWFE